MLSYARWALSGCLDVVVVGLVFVLDGCVLVARHRYGTVEPKGDRVMGSEKTARDLSECERRLAEIMEREEPFTLEQQTDTAEM